LYKAFFVDLRSLRVFVVPAGYRDACIGGHTLPSTPPPPQ
jgi:hypothetical protein